MDARRLIATRMSEVDVSGIRKVFDLAATLKDPINLSIGQPDFDVPAPIRQAAADAIAAGHNRYTPTQGIAALLGQIRANLGQEFASRLDTSSVLVTSGVSGALVLALQCLIDPGDEVIFLDPYFLMYKQLTTLCGGVPIMVSNYPDFRLPLDAIEQAITPRTKCLIINSPANPTGEVFSADELAALADLARRHELLVISDEIYNLFCYEPYASIASWYEHTLLLRGFSKSYGMTGWRMGYAVGPAPIVAEMTKLQQFTFVCAPSPAQVAAVAALSVDMSHHVAEYAGKRSFMVDGLRAAGYDVRAPGGGFYLFVPVAAGYQNATQFVHAAIERQLLIIPGNVFSQRDTHFRISYAASQPTLARGLAVFAELAEAGQRSPALASA